MNKIKSRRAKECADRYICTGVHKGVHRYKYVIQAIELAEQDAEERAVKAAKLWFTKLFPTITHPATIDIMADDFIELLNNGGQDE